MEAFKLQRMSVKLDRYPFAIHLHQPNSSLRVMVAKKEMTQLVKLSEQVLVLKCNIFVLTYKYLDMNIRSMSLREKANLWLPKKILKSLEIQRHEFKVDNIEEKMER